MKKWLFLLVLTNFYVLAADESCDDTINEGASKLNHAIIAPDFKFSYSLNPKCEYTVTTVANIFSSITSAGDFLENEIMNPAKNLASADRNSVLAYKLDSIGGGKYSQVATVKKKGQTTKIYQKCILTKSTSAEGEFKCVVDTDKTKFKGIIKIFEKNETTIRCINKSKYMKQCTFKTVGLSANIPMLGNSCQTARFGASETFESVYRLASYVSGGSVGPLQKIKAANKSFETRAAGKMSQQIDVSFPLK